MKGFSSEWLADYNANKAPDSAQNRLADAQPADMVYGEIHYSARPARREAPKNSSEHKQQVKLFKWAAENVKYYPHLAALYAVPNAAKRSKVMGAQMKAEGLKAGVNDIHLPAPIGGYTGLWIEMKYGYNKLTDLQREWADLMRWLGHRTEVCYWYEEARWVLLDYLTDSGKLLRKAA